MQRYIQSLGFNEEKAILDHPILINAHGGPDDNSYYDPSPEKMISLSEMEMWIDAEMEILSFIVRTCNTGCHNPWFLARRTKGGAWGKDSGLCSRYILDKLRKSQER